jgi:hypothetical protein
LKKKKKEEGRAWLLECRDCGTKKMGQEKLQKEKRMLQDGGIQKKG